MELHVHSAFTFLEGASLPEQLATQAADLGHEALALTDRDDVGGHVRFLEAATKVGLRPIVGAELTVRPTPLFDGTRQSDDGRFALGGDIFGLVLLAKDATGYANLSALVSKGRFERPRGRPYVTLDEVAARAEGLVALTAFLEGPLAPALRRGDVDEGLRLLGPWLDVFGDDLLLEVQDHALPEERAAIATTLAIAARLDRTPARGKEPGVLATNHVHHVTRKVKCVEDVLRCIKHQCTIDDAGDRLFPNDERHLRSHRTMLRRFHAHPELVHAAGEIAERCEFRLSDLVAPLPCFPTIESLVRGSSERSEDDAERQRLRSSPLRNEKVQVTGGEVGRTPSGTTERVPPTADETLAHLAWEGAKVRYGELSDKHRSHLQHELDVIAKLQFAGYFLILWDIVRAAKELTILVQGRGSAANSAVCYCLGITAVDPIG
ncbi:MAG: PHP domain-containing protein, partial [Polyangiales bacterium]